MALFTTTAAYNIGEGRCSRKIKGEGREREMHAS
jgi:hypothetical protein